MTRENKIGLLVGLAFIIAVGILISNYLSVTNEPQQKSLQVAGSAVRSSLGDPAPTADPLSSPSTVRVPNAIAPSNPVPTAGELAARSRAASPAIEPVITKTTDQMLPYPAFVAAPSNPAAVPPGQNQSLLDAARRAGEALIAPSDDPSTTPPVAAPRHAAARTVVAESGDSLSDLAEKAYGSSTKATRNAIIAANPSLRANPNLIRAGQSYLVTTADSNTDDVPPTHATTPAAKSSSTVAMYTVRQGDTLYSIARDEVGTVKAVAAIKDLNRDVLHGDHLRLNMQLKLPKRKASSES